MDGSAVALGGPSPARRARDPARARQRGRAGRAADRRDLGRRSRRRARSNVVQGYVSQLRKLLGTRADRHARARLRADRAGRRARPAPLRAARRRRHGGARGRPAGAAPPPQLGAALALWRGPALSDVAELPAVRPIAARLDELRLPRSSGGSSADLDCGRAGRGGGGAGPADRRAPAARAPARACRCARSTAAAARPTRSRRSAPRGRRSSASSGSSRAPSCRSSSARSCARTRPSCPRVDDAVRAAAATVLAARAGPGVAAGARRARALRSRGAGPASCCSPRRSRPPRSSHRSRPSCASWARRSSSRGSRHASPPSPRSRPGSTWRGSRPSRTPTCVLVDAPAGLLEDARLIALLDQAPCDVAVLVGDQAPRPGPVLVPFSGAEHDWAAVELGAWLAQSLDCGLQLAGASTGAAGRDASRLLASASLALQRAVGVHADPLLVEPSPAALVGAARDAGVVVVGLTERWQREGLGPARTALATDAGAPDAARAARAAPRRPGGPARRHALHLDDRGRRLISAPTAGADVRGGNPPARRPAPPSARAGRRSTGRRPARSLSGTEPRLGGRGRSAPARWRPRPGGWRRADAAAEQVDPQAGERLAAGEPDRHRLLEPAEHGLDGVAVAADLIAARDARRARPGKARANARR